MAKSVLELAVGTGQWDAGLKKARTALDNFTQANGGLQSALTKDSASMQKFVQMMGRMDSTAKTAKGQMNDYKGTIEQLTMQYNRLTDAQKKTIGQDYLRSIDQMKQKYQGVAEEVNKINQSLKSMPEPAALSGGGGLFGGDNLSGMLQVFGGNMMTKLAGVGVGFVSELKDMVAQGIELARAGEGVRIAFQRLGRGDLLDGLRQATHGTVTDLELMKAAVKFNDFKLPLDELGTMLAFAQQKAKDTGQSVDYMVDSIVTGLGRKSLMILDNLGLSAAEVKEKMAETGDMTKAVGAIIREQMSKAGDYVETAADRATKANVELENAMTRLGETFQPLSDSATSMWTDIKVGALDLLNSAIKPLIDKLTEAGRLRAQLNNINAGTGTNQTRAGKDLGYLKYEIGKYGANDPRITDLYNRQRGRYIQQENQAWRQAQSAQQHYEQKRKDGASQADLNAYYQRWQTMEAQAKAWGSVLKEYDEGFKKLSSSAKVNVNTDEAEQNITSLTKKLKELQEQRKKAIAAGDKQKSADLLKQINQVKADIKGPGGSTTTTTTTHQTPQQRAQESFTKAEQNYKQALEQAAMELQAGTITRAEAKKKEMQAAEQRWKAIGDARNISDSENLRKAQDEAAAEYKRLAAEAKTATEHQKAVDKATRDLENANQKLATARQEMAQAKQKGDLQAYNTAKDKAAAAQQEITRLEKVKVDVETGRVDLPDIPKVIEQTVNTHQGELMTAEIAKEITQTINTRLGRIVTPDILESITQTINTKVGNVITPEIAKEVTQVVNVETGTVDLPEIPATTTTTVNFEANTRNIDAAISYVKKEMDTIPVGTIAFNLDQTKLADLTTLKTLISEQMKNGLQIDPNFAQSMFSNILAGKDIKNTTWQAQVDTINKDLTANRRDPLKIDYETGEKEKDKGNDKETKKLTDEISTLTSGLSSIAGGLKSMGIDLPAEVDQVIGVIQGVTSVIEGVNAVISIFSTSTMAANTFALGANTAALWAVAATNFFPFANGGVVHAANGYVDGNTYSGDKIPALLNAGELVLNRAQQGNLASQLEGGVGAMQLSAIITGEQLRLVLNNNGRRTGRGEYVTTNFR